MVNLRHGMSGTPEYRAFIDAKCRCSNKNNQRYPWYGARGIEFRFDSFVDFFDEIGPKPADEYSLDRIDNEGHYETGNVHWATKYEQIHNRRKHETPWLEGNSNNAKEFVVTHPDGHKENVFNMAEFCRKYGLNKANLHKTIEGKLAKTHKGFKAEYATCQH